MRRVFGFGETVLDIIFKDGRPVAAKPGGSVLNSFISLGRLGWDPCFISEYAHDDVGKLIDSYLKDNGVNTRYINRFSDGKSALALAFLDEKSNARYSFYKDFPEQRLQALPEDLDSGDIILFGSIYASTHEVRDSVLRFLEMGRTKGCLIIYDPNFRQAHLNELPDLRPRILENIEYADIIRGSDEDFRLIFGIDEHTGVSGLVDSSSKVLLYTCNKKGVYGLYRSHAAHVLSEKLNPVSTIGAGDNFNAGIVHYLLKKNVHRPDLEGLDAKGLQQMAETGVAFASHVCMQYDNYISQEFADSIKQTPDLT